MSPAYESRGSTRHRFLTNAAGTAGAIVLGVPLTSCSSSSGYDDAVRQMRRPLERRVSERRTMQRELVRFATLAPSGHNAQCWKFELEKARISILPDFARRTPAVDPDDHHLFVSLGCATENLVQAARTVGLRSNVSFDPRGDGAVRVAFEPASAFVSPLFRTITSRQCTRDAYDGRSVPPRDLRMLERVGEGAGVRVLMVTRRSEMERVLAYVVRGNTAQMNDPVFMRELRTWIRFNEREALARCDGLSSLASGNPQVPRVIGDIAFEFAFTPQSENDKYAEFIRSSSGIAVFVSDASDREHWVETGRRYERFVLAATSLGIRTAMVNQPVEVSSLRSEFASSLGIGRHRPDLVVRFGYGAAMPQSLRRPVDAVIV